MTAATIALARRRRITLRRRATLATTLAIVGGAIALAVALTLGGSDGERRAHAQTFTAADGSFSVSYPRGWRAQAAGAAGSNAVIARADGRGMLVVRERGAVEGSFHELARDLGPQLKRRFKDFKAVSARVVRLSTGPALSYTFVRTRSGMVQGIVVAPAGKRTYTIETVSPGDAPDVAKQLGGIVRSFTKNG
jgi:hypothetical protein